MKTMTARNRAAVLAVVLLAIPASMSGGTARTRTPPPLTTAYRAWKNLTPQPQVVPYALSIQCAHVTQAQINAALKNHGPHTWREITVYANPTAVATLDDPKAREFPPGAAIAKEKRSVGGGTGVEGVALMVKHPAGEYAESGGWEFMYIPNGGDKGSGQGYQGCVSCHRAGATKDYVFGVYVFGLYGPPLKRR